MDGSISFELENINSCQSACKETMNLSGARFIFFEIKFKVKKLSTKSWAWDSYEKKHFQRGIFQKEFPHFSCK